MSGADPTPSTKRIVSGVFPATPGLDPIAAQLLQGVVVSFRCRELIAKGDLEAAWGQLALVYEAIDAVLRLGASADEPRVAQLVAGAERLDAQLSPSLAESA